MFAIIPAAGKATRFNGIYKELLPINKEGDTGLSNALKLAKKFGVRMAYIISNEEKGKVHNNYRTELYDKEYKNGTLPLSYIVDQEYDEDLWGAIKTGNDYFLDDPLYSHCIMIMPDTIPIIDYPPSLSHIKRTDIYLGLFETQLPERYSVLSGKGLIETKRKPQHISGFNGFKMYFNAWGITIWSKPTALCWKENNDVYISRAQETGNAIYDEAFNEILKLKITKKQFFQLRNYYDIGSWERYVEYIKDTQ